MVLTWGAVMITFDVSGVLRWVSQMIRAGFLPSGIRQVNCGSSARMVPSPVMTALNRFLVLWTCSRACSPVIHLD